MERRPPGLPPPSWLASPPPPPPVPPASLSSLSSLSSSFSRTTALATATTTAPRPRQNSAAAPSSLTKLGRSSSVVRTGAVPAVSSSSSSSTLTASNRILRWMMPPPTIPIPAAAARSLRSQPFPRQSSTASSKMMPAPPLRSDGDRRMLPPAPSSALPRAAAAPRPPTFVAPARSGSSTTTNPSTTNPTTTTTRVAAPRPSPRPLGAPTTTTLRPPRGRYRCPTCKTDFPTYGTCRQHLRDCNPGLLLNPNGLQQRCRLAPIPPTCPKAKKGKKKKRDHGSSTNNNTSTSSNNNNHRKGKRQRCDHPSSEDRDAAAMVVPATTQQQQQQQQQQQHSMNLPPPPPQRSMATAGVVSTSRNKTKDELVLASHKNNHMEVIDLCDDDSDDDAIIINNTTGTILPPNNNNAPSRSNSTTHIIFAIDYSGSMKTRDVTTTSTSKFTSSFTTRKKNNKKNKNSSQSAAASAAATTTTRWDAVFECMDEFLVDQITEQQQQDAAATPAMTTVVSVVLFNDAAETVLQYVPLQGDGRRVRDKLQVAHQQRTPHGGTGFAAGFALVNTISRQYDTKNNSSNSNTIVVFLSDGRPGDLNPKPPKRATLPMQTTFRRNKQTYPAVGEHIEALQQRHGNDEQHPTTNNSLAVHFICIANEGKRWLKYLADRYHGYFHEPELDMHDEEMSSNGIGRRQHKKRQAVIDSDSDDNDHDHDHDEDYVDDDEDESEDEIVIRRRQQRQAVIDNDSDYYTDDDDEEEEDVVEMVVKSQETLLREKYNRAKSAGQVYSVMTTTTNGNVGSSSMRSTFQSISSSVTAMRGGNNARKRLTERQGVIIQEQSPMISYQAAVMVMNMKTEKFSVPANTKELTVKVSLHPFAQGGLRNVYRMESKKIARLLNSRNKLRIKTKGLVAKESRHDVGYSERLRFHIESSKCQAKAITYAGRFKNRMKKIWKDKVLLSRNNLINTTIPLINMLHADVFRLTDSTSKGGFRYLSVESEMNNRTYTKWNSNNGYVHPNTECLPCKVAQAFSHFSYEASHQQEMVVDIQGCEYTYTDPQIHSRSKEFGRADRACRGMEDFFKTHQCNFLCTALQLPNRSTTIQSPSPQQTINN